MTRFATPTRANVATYSFSTATPNPATLVGSDKFVQGAVMTPRWDDPELAVDSDSKRTARYRRLQSLWRETVVGLPRGRIQRATALEAGSQSLPTLSG